MLLETKIIRPSIPAVPVLRPRLLEALDRLYQYPLSIISGPAGYGKTTLVSHWLEQRKLSCAWITLDARDNDEHLFWSYLCSALAHIDRRFAGTPLAAFDRAGGDQLEHGVSALIHELLEYSRTWRAAGKLLIVFDDFHLLQNPDLLARFNRFLDYCPDSVRCLLTTRQEPALELAKRRVRHQLLEIGEARLRFNLEETGAFLQQRMALHLPAGELRQIHEKTQGWAAAIQLVGLSLQNHPGQPARDLFREPDEGLSEYLLEQVFLQQPQQIRDFLVFTAFLPRLQAALCDEVLRWDRSADLLEQLARHNLLIQRLDGDWFRLHDLFRDWLMLRFGELEPEFAVTLRRRAAGWLEARQLVLEALEQTLALADWEWSARLLIPGFQEIAQRGAYTSAGWICRQFPEEELWRNPWLCCLKASVAFNHNDMGESRRYLQQAQALLTAPDTSPETAAALNPLVTFLCSHLARFEGDLEQSKDLLLQIQHQRMTEDNPYYAWTRHSLGGDAFARGDLAEAQTHLTAAMTLSARYGDHFCQLNTLFWLVPTLLHRGRLPEALQWIEATEQELRQHAPGLASSGAIPYCRGMIYREQGRLREARELAAEAYTKAESLHPINRVDCLFLQMMVAMSLADLSGARATLRQLVQLHEALGTPWHYPIPTPGPFFALFDLLEGNAFPLIQWSQAAEAELTGEASFRRNAEDIFMLLGQVLQGRLDTHDLMRCRQQARDNDNRFRLLQSHSLEALYHFSQNDHEAALQAMQKALSLSASHGFTQVILDSGPVMLRLLLLCRQAEILPREVERLLTAAGRPLSGVQTAAAEVAVETLSERERQLLQLLDSGLTNQDLAASMGIAAATVKAHLRNIYGKLSARNRTQALARARQLGILL